MSTNEQPEIEIEVTDGNIFADLGLDNADELYTCACLGIQVMKIIRERNYNHQDAAALLDLKASEVAAIMEAKFSGFSQEHLIGLLNKLNWKVIIQISNHNQGEPYQQVVLAS
jgi:predicted XRE-type DNA-binding protein